MEKSGIIHYFGEYLFWDVYVQGIFACLTLLVGLSLWVYTLADYFDPEKNVDLIDYLKNKYKGLYDLVTITVKLKIVKYVSYLVVSLSVIYTVGIVVSTLSDNFMDKSNYWHSGLKRYWASDLHKKSELAKYFISKKEFSDLDGTDNLIKIISFNKIFAISNLNKGIYSDSSGRSFFLKVKNDSLGFFRRDVYYHAKYSAPPF